jgi:hypothetical protein
MKKIDMASAAISAPERGRSGPTLNKDIDP